MYLRKLNEYGISLFRNYITSLPGVIGPDIPPKGLLNREDTSVSIRPTVEVPEGNITDRLDAAKRINAILSPLPADVRTDVESDPGLWAWLSLYYFDSVCPLVRGSRKPGDMSRHLITSGARNQYRHLLASPYEIYKSFGAAHHLAMALLYTSVNQPGELAEQLTASQHLISNKNVVQAYSSLYFDISAGKNKIGAAGAGRGSARRFSPVLNQFDRTYDLGSMSTAQLLDLLPAEFDRYK